MPTLHTMKILARDLISPIATRISPVRWKEFNEHYYWKLRKQAEGVLSNQHYKHFYTTHFGLRDDDYVGKVVLDIGCGPRGSLEWASMASRRMGLDPLAAEYLRLGAEQHRMEYIDAPSENIPLKDAECDVVCSFNSLDHVEDVERTLKEIKRVTRAGGLFLLLVETNHAPTDCEPHRLTPQGLIASLKPEFKCEGLQVYRPVRGGIYNSILADERVPQPADTTEQGFLSARFIRTTPG